MKSKVYMIIPSYNEGHKLKTVLNDVNEYVNQIVVIDDGSTDETIKLTSSEQVKILRHEINLGQGAALQTGLEWARDHSAEVVITYDADGQFLPTDIPIVLEPIIKDRADVVLGSRFLGKTINMPIIKKITLKLAIFFTYLFSNIKLSDTHNGFRAFNKKALNKINISQDRMAHASEIIHLASLKKLRVVEVPVTIQYNNYTIKKGQKITNIFWILFDLILKKL